MDHDPDLRDPSGGGREEEWAGLQQRHGFRPPGPMGPLRRDVTRTQETIRGLQKARKAANDISSVPFCHYLTTADMKQAQELLGSTAHTGRSALPAHSR